MRQFYTGNLASAGVLILSALPLPIPLFMQTAYAQEATASQGVEDIIVTAQRRSENLQNVPIAITALSSDRLSAGTINSTQDLQLVTPGLQFISGAGSSTPRLRGVGTSATGPGVENAVATYIDNVYIASQSGSVLALNNIAQVSVLKGPQGTLFGRNATGGVVQITTRDPEDEFSGKASLTYGNHKTYGGNLYLTGGLANGLAADLALYYNNLSDGFGRNLATGRRVGEDESFSVRSKLRWDLGDRTRILLAGDYSQVRQSLPAYRPLDGSIAAGNYVFAGGPFDTDQDLDPRLTSDFGGVSAQLHHDFGAVRLVSISAYRKSKLHIIFDIDRTPAFLINTDTAQIDSQFSQELQLLSTAKGPFEWVVGAYYFNSKGKYKPNGTITSNQPATVAASEIYSEQTAESYAGFAQGTYHFDGGTNLTAGLRYTEEVRDFDGVIGNRLRTGGFTPTGTSTGHVRFSKLTWRLAVDHRFSREFLIYASYNRGAKSGLFNPGSISPPLVTPTPQATPVDPEQLDAYEAGFKSDLFDRHLRLNAGFYYYDYKNIQLNRFVNAVQVLYNAASAKLYGLDADAELVVTPRFTLQGGLNITHSKFGSFPGAVTSIPRPGGGYTVGPTDATGNKLLRTPDWTANASFTYRLPVGPGEVTFSGDYYHSDGWFSDADNRLKQKPYDIVGGSIAWKPQDERYNLRLWAKNLFNEVYAVTITSSSRVDALWVAQGRTFGVTAGFNF